ncbi:MULTISPECIES: TolC family protein [Leeuwenhoekiella]|jgi:outer membrane protein TolC|uniref:TolC family protein n=1 Tax=Leeuwenhoekiella TaxID=283735 RepID=UPI000C3B052F|nr:MULTISPECIES: TolC family protein [Leeuwenhoekiella]MAO42364.1 transporter [Leeuwenhoekiella sp.]MBQ51089.1 transporter [Leeuwenhoekiella sp.]HBT08965.1 transporter [Leeuwenhoekiella sp.]HCW65023.1 transporter [Leeuwenhoekiella sp.]|tara:strand:- start:23701 stop:25080 length:1380 start_codon:yes stop_codon:yes gene_type:complete
MRKTIFLLICVLGSLNTSKAQDSTEVQSYALSLQEAITYGLENSYDAKNAYTDVEIALKQKWEIIAQGLPQISGEVTYQNQFIQPTSFIPAVVFDPSADPGDFIPVQFSQKQNASAVATWNQLIFDGSYIVGVQSAKTLLQISENAKVKTDLEVKQAIIEAYGNVLLAQESVAILQKNIETVNKNLNDTQKIFENGLGEEEDVEQLQITALNLESQLNSTVRQLAIAYDMLKLTLGIPIDSKLVVTDALEDLTMQYYDLNLLARDIDPENNIDYRIAEDQANLAETEVKLEKSKALPTLSAYVNYGAAGASNSFTFLSDEQRYFEQSILGVSLSVPIFSSGMRAARTAQKELAYKQSLEDLERARNQVKLEIASARNDYQFALDNFATQEKNLDLAERIENKNSIKFFEGIASSFELSEAQTQLYQAQQDYLQAMYEVIANKAALEKVLDTSVYKPKED